MSLRPIVYPLTIFHGPGHDYSRWDSPEGVREAHAAGATAMDVNAQASKGRRFVPTHWRFPGDHGFNAPTNLRHKAVSSLTPAELDQFTSKSGHKIHTMREVMTTAVSLDMTLTVEAKSDGDFDALREDAEATGCRVIVSTLPHLGGKNVGYRRLEKAKAAGLPTLVLLNTTKYARGQIPAGEWKHLDYVKGPTIWQKGRPSRVIRLGGGSKYGVTVGVGNARKVTARLRKQWPAVKPQPVPTPEPVPKPKPEVPVPAPGSTQQERVIAAINAEVGYHEGRSGGHWNNVEKYAAQVPGLKWVSDQGQPWCAVFAAWGFAKGGLSGGKDFPVTASCDVGGNWYKAHKRWSEYPAVGAQVFFGSPRDLNHTGIVVAYDATTITSVEGNTNDSGSREGDGVYLKTHRRRDVNVVGYGYPTYDTAIKSADPSFARPSKPGAPKPGGVKPWPIDGIDLSHHNSGRIDWPLAKAGGVRFVYHKATQHTSFRDSMYASRRAEVKAQRGVAFGAYHYAQPDKSSGTVQARFFLAVAKPTKGELRPMLDLEETGGLSMVALTKWVRAFVAEVKRQTGKPPVIYTKFDLTSAPGAFLWTARYSNKNDAPHVPKAWGKGWTIHQFSNGEFGVPRRCPGIAFPVDINTLAPGFDLNRLKL